MAMRPANRLLLLASLAGLCVGCAASQEAPHRSVTAGQGAAALSLDLAETRPAGLGPAFRPPPVAGSSVALGQPVGSLRCLARPGVSYGAHIELFADNRGVVVPAGIGFAEPQRRRGVFVLGGRCAYPLRTVDPTGVIEIDRATGGSAPTVGELFRLWGQPLSRSRLAGFAGSVAAFVDGRRWAGDPRSIPLARHAQVVLELGPFVEPHGAYLFPPGL
jgi:hypothetical protein